MLNFSTKTTQGDKSIVSKSKSLPAHEPSWVTEHIKKDEEKYQGEESNRIPKNKKGKKRGTKSIVNKESNGKS